MGATTEKARSLNVDEVRGITRKCLSEDRSVQTGLYRTGTSDKYPGAVPCKDVHVKISNLNLKEYCEIFSFSHLNRCCLKHCT